MLMKPEFTNGTFLNGKLKIKQSKTGYRFSIDSILIANLVQLKPENRVLEIGTGCGIISLILAHRYPDTDIYAIEIQKELLETAAINISENNMTHVIKLIDCDVKNLSHSLISGPVNVVVCNPPHRKANSGRINPSYQVAVARHEITMTLDDLTHAAEKMLFKSGRFIVIYPSERMVEVLLKMRSVNIEPKKIRLIHSSPDSDAIRCLIEGVKGAKPGISVAPPLSIYNNDGTYSDMVKKMFSLDSSCPDER